MMPNLSRIVEASIPLSGRDFPEFQAQLRQDVLPHIRGLQAGGHLRWFSVLIHNANQLLVHDSTDMRLVIHLRLEPAMALSFDEFVQLLPSHFEAPKPRPESNIGGVQEEIVAGGEWARAWEMVGQSSEWLLSLLEATTPQLTAEQLVQFLHYITNPLMPDLQCEHIPSGLRF